MVRVGNNGANQAQHQADTLYSKAFKASRSSGWQKVETAPLIGELVRHITGFTLSIFKEISDFFDKGSYAPPRPPLQASPRTPHGEHIAAFMNGQRNDPTDPMTWTSRFASQFTG